MFVPSPAARRHSKAYSTPFPGPSHQLFHKIGEPCDRIWAALGLCSGGRARERVGRGQKAANDLGQGLGRQVLLLHAPGAPVFRQPTRILQLIVVDGMRQRDKYGRAAHHGKLRHRGGTGAADDQVRLGHLLGQVGEERGQVGADAGLPIGLLDAREVFLAALLHHEQAALIASGSGASAGGHGVGEDSARPGCRRTPAARTARRSRRLVALASPSRPPGRARDCRSPAPWRAQRPSRSLVFSNEAAIGGHVLGKPRLARPSTAFCSCSAVGILRRRAATSGGKAG